MERKENPQYLRFEDWVNKRFPMLSRRQTWEAVEHLVLKDGRKVKKGVRLNSDEGINYKPLLDHINKIKLGNPNLKIEIIFEDRNMWVIDKPAGIKSHPLSLFDLDTVTHWALSKDPLINNEFKQIQPVLSPHRLDTGTSGLLIVCKTLASYQSIRELFRTKKFLKSYLAWCWGEPLKPSYVVSECISHHPKDKKRMVVLKKGRVFFRGPRLNAESEVNVRLRDRNYFLCEVKCRTGVTHQVRVHLASIGFPILGDLLYDPIVFKRPLTFKTHLLRATRIEGPLNFNASDEDFIKSPLLFAS